MSRVSINKRILGKPEKSMNKENPLESKRKVIQSPVNIYGKNEIKIETNLNPKQRRRGKNQNSISKILSNDSLKSFQPKIHINTNPEKPPINEIILTDNTPSKPDKTPTAFAIPPPSTQITPSILQSLDKRHSPIIPISSKPNSQRESPTPLNMKSSLITARSQSPRSKTSQKIEKKKKTHTLFLIIFLILLSLLVLLPIL